DRGHPYGTPDAKPFRWIRGYQLGGRSLIWGRACWRWSDLDFTANLRDGHGVDWPIRYKDLAPWYDYVERFVGVSGERLGLGHLPDGEFLPPWDLTCAERVVQRGIERAFRGRHLTITRVANLTRAHNGRGPCQARNQCARGCSFGGYFSSLSATLPAARNTGRLTLGTAQILLSSRSARFPTGLANSSGELGHNLMDHISKAGAHGTVPGLEDKYVYGRRPTGSYIPRFRNLGTPGEAKVGFLRGYGIQAGSGRQGWGRGADAPGLGVELKQRLREPGPWGMTLQGYGECLPRHENYVDLDPERTDQWGIPLPRVHCAWSENERAIREDVKAQSAEMLEAAGCTSVE